MNIRLIPEEFIVCKLTSLDEVIMNKPYTFVAVTDDEISLVCAKRDLPLGAEVSEEGWRIFKIDEILDFTLIGIIGRIGSLLAEKAISIFVVSTFNTDYFMVKEKMLSEAIGTLEENGYAVFQ